MRATLLALLIAGCATAPRYTSPRPVLDGDWQLDTDASNDATVFAVDRNARETRAIARLDSILPNARFRADTLIRRPPQHMRIAAHDSMVWFRFDEDADVALRIGDGARDVRWFDGETWLVSVRWHEGRLQLRRQRRDHPWITEYFDRSRGSDRLVVFSVMSGGEGEVSVRRVYRAAE